MAYNLFVMKVIEKGREQKGWASEYRCTGLGNKGGGCNSLLLVEEADLFHTYRSIMGRDEEWYVTFQCSECEVLTDVKDSPFYGRQLPSFTNWKQRKSL
jgi:hypothetical protein